MGLVAYNQAGYSGYSMSIRAVEAYEDGEKPKSKWTKAAMTDTVRSYCREEELFFDEAVLKGMNKKEVFSTLFIWKSWHHTGKCAQETDFYGIDGEAVRALFRELREDEVVALREAERVAEEAREAKRQEWERCRAALEEAGRRFEEENGFEYGSAAHFAAVCPDKVVRRRSKKGNMVIDVSCEDGEVITFLERDSREGYWGFERFDWEGEIPSLAALVSPRDAEPPRPFLAGRMVAAKDLSATLEVPRDPGGSPLAHGDGK